MSGMMKQVNGNRSLGNTQRGLTLIELMVAMALGLIITLGVANVYLASKRGSFQDDELAGLQENARFALGLLKHDLLMAGYTAGFADFTLFAPSAVTGDCSGATNWATNIKLYGRMEFANDVAASYSEKCVGNVVAQTDVLAVRRAADEFTRRNSTQVTLVPPASPRLYFTGDGIVPGNTAAAKPWALEYVVKSYFIRDYSNTVGDSIPCLAMSYLTDTPSMQTECVLSGVQDLQIVWGIDTTTTPGGTPKPDSTPELYVDNPTAAQLNQAVSVQVFLLVRSINPIPDYTDNKTYTLGSRIEGPFNDKYYRRVFSTVVRIPNNYVARPSLI